ncbi:helix-turn-helix domain-containing protein [Proteus sp. DFP240708]|uniref:Helix-turn-helix transcriptional regulator n=2 Tax=Proteus TaxID=583 RepID=A0A6I7D4R3_9GAMM|nr:MULTISPECIES: helix-turn-helix transcriptional regulator [Proteus]MBG2709044.1 helix-turn-helix transcriptional regulator [Proteus mirabilis]MBG2769132.1 helix-turn-helix transcriptional regulator [Proteus mirabilis]MBG3018294.1 helix-turn-helix transcriptional regulator [Proteus mirabilis]MBG3150975.1 helix-turn-helix transcriptional regulator [Proteus mirabilis]MBI6215384.1 helix-turn-helix transcriptional regulator [Proteus vulgaris]
MMDYDLININVNELVGQRIQKKRKELGYTGAHIADKLGISQQQFSRYERGLNKIDLSYLVTLAVYLKTPIYWFFEDCFHVEAETEDKNIRKSTYFMAESTPDFIF